MMDIAERLREIGDSDDWLLLQEAATKIERLQELLRGVGANRYWEGRWRDEAAENDQLREELDRYRLLALHEAASSERLAEENDRLQADIEYCGENHISKPDRTGS